MSTSENRTRNDEQHDFYRRFKPQHASSAKAESTDDWADFVDGDANAITLASEGNGLVTVVCENDATLEDNATIAQPVHFRLMGRLHDHDAGTASSWVPAEDQNETLLETSDPVAAGGTHTFRSAVLFDEYKVQQKSATPGTPGAGQFHATSR